MAKDKRLKDAESRLKTEGLFEGTLEEVVPSELKETADIAPTPEAVPEQSVAEIETAVTEDALSEIAEPSAKPVGASTTKTVSKPIDRLEEEIEDILEEDLKELYLAMPADKRAAFRHKGEETRSKVRALVASAKVNARKVFSLIRDWLKMIPGVNRFFLEQEAKIKTDKILVVSEEEKNRSSPL